MKLGQIVNIAAGYPFRGKIPEVVNSGVVAVQMKDVSINEGICWQTCIETKLPGKREPDWLQPGDILFIARGSNNYAVLVDEALADRRAIAAPHFYVISCKNANLLPEFLVWLLNQRPCQRYFQREAEGTLTKSVRRSVLEATPVALPSMTKQHSIVQLANALKQEQRLIEQLVRNGETLMNTIANDLMSNGKGKGAEDA